jgi:hypothetical protein
VGQLNKVSQNELAEIGNPIAEIGNPLSTYVSSLSV